MFQKPKIEEIYSIFAKNIICIYCYIVIKDIYQTCFLYVKLFGNCFVFPKGDADGDLGEPLWLGNIMPNTVYDQFQKNIVGG